MPVAFYLTSLFSLFFFYHSSPKTLKNVLKNGRNGLLLIWLKALFFKGYYSLL